MAGHTPECPGFPQGRASETLRPDKPLNIGAQKLSGGQEQELEPRSPGPQVTVQVTTLALLGEVKSPSRPSWDPKSGLNPELSQATSNATLCEAFSGLSSFGAPRVPNTL